MNGVLHTVVETAEFLARSSKLMFALTVFAKNERANLTAAQRNAMTAVVKTIKQQLET